MSIEKPKLETGNKMPDRPKLETGQKIPSRPKLPTGCPSCRGKK